VLLQCVLQCVLRMWCVAHPCVVAVYVKDVVFHPSVLLQCLLQCVLRMWYLAHLCVVAVCDAMRVKVVV